MATETKKHETKDRGQEPDHGTTSKEMSGDHALSQLEWSKGLKKEIERVASLLAKAAREFMEGLKKFSALEALKLAIYSIVNYFFPGKEVKLVDLNYSQLKGGMCVKFSFVISYQDERILKIMVGSLKSRFKVDCEVQALTTELMNVTLTLTYAENINNATS